ncbi:NAT_SF domain containing protein [Candidatus Nanopelagicaceae bacterium]
MIRWDKLKFRNLGYRDSHQLYLALKDSGSDYLGAYLEWGTRINMYSEAAVRKTVVMDITQPLPHEHFVVEYLGQLVAFGSSGKSSFAEGVQITYWVRRSFSGQGIGTWLVSEMISHLFFVRNRSIIEIHTDRSNTASARIPNSLGFSPISDYTQSKNFGHKSSKEMIVWVKMNPRVTVSSNLERFRVGRMFKDSYAGISRQETQ